MKFDEKIKKASDKYMSEFQLGDKIISFVPPENKYVVQGRIVDIDGDHATIKSTQHGTFKVNLRTSVMDSTARLEEIKDEIKELLAEAKQIVRKQNRHEWESASGYWYSHILCALDDDHDYLGGSMSTMQDTIDTLNGEDEADD
jgi:chromosome segregation ATPase